MTRSVAKSLLASAAGVVLAICCITWVAKNGYAEIGSATPADEALWIQIESLKKISLENEKLDFNLLRRPDPLEATIPTSVLEQIDLATNALKRVYGSDDRSLVIGNQLTSPVGGGASFITWSDGLSRNLQAVVLMVSREEARENADGTLTLLPKILGDKHRLCADEPFRTLGTAGACSGFLIAPDRIATAAHCVRDGIQARRSYFVFGYRQGGDGTVSAEIARSDVFRGVELVDRDSDLDWAVVKLDREVGAERKPVKIAEHAPNEGTPIYTAGHPEGLPLIVAPNAKILDATQPRWLVADIDVNYGASGSFVANATSHEIEGIVSAGSSDYLNVGGCQKSFVCVRGGDCNGERLARIDPVRRYAKPVE